MADPYVHGTVGTEPLLPSSPIRYAFPWPMYMLGQRCTWTGMHETRKHGHVKSFKVGCKGKITDIYNRICPGHGFVTAWHVGRAISHRYQGRGGRGSSGNFFVPASKMYPESLDYFVSQTPSPPPPQPRTYMDEHCTACKRGMWQFTKESGWVYWCTGPVGNDDNNVQPPKSPSLCVACQLEQYKTQQLGVVCTHGYDHIRRCTSCDTAPLQRVPCGLVCTVCSPDRSTCTYCHVKQVTHEMLSSTSLCPDVVQSLIGPYLHSLLHHHASILEPVVE